jgi:hypothetical protein
MGLFGGSKTYVSSVLYNLAGPEEDRVNYMKTLVVGNVLMDSRFSMSDTLQNGLLNGPGIKARSFYRWAVNNYAHVGVPPMVLQSSGAYTEADIEPEIPTLPGETAEILEVQEGYGDVTFWAERFILENHPTKIADDWEIEYDGTTVDITFPDATTDSFAPASPAMSSSNYYFYVSYNRKDGMGVVIGQAIWIYQVGSGNAVMDALVNSDAEESYFFPFIPIRHETQFLSSTYLSTTYELSKKAYKKATGGSLDELIEKIADNDDLDDIDYAYIVYGVPLNAIDNSARKYLFQFFSNLEEVGGVNRVQIQSPGSSVAKLNMIISWTSLSRSTGSGLKKPDAKAGEVWLTGTTTIAINFQETVHSWTTIEIANPKHENIIYNGKAVVITGAEALADAEESGFLVPLHYETVKDLSLADSTQMMTASTFIVFNCYQVVKQKWYQTGIFKIFVFIAIIAITVVTAGTGTGPALALYASIGAAVGLAGIAAVIAGVVIASLATMLIMKILTLVSTAIFGEKFGMIIAAVAAVVMTVMAPGIMSGQSLSAMWGSMMSAQNLMMLTNALGTGIADYVKASAMNTIEETQELVVDYQKEANRIQGLYAENIGYGNGMIDPLNLTSFLAESGSQFVSRTLMTGTDIAQMSMDMLTNFSDYTINVDLPG